jgi:quercetin 2,3-dioxygenase
MILAPRTVKLTTRTGIDIHRTLPHRSIRTIGAWCFIDHFGPTTQEDAMSVAAHPHVGLQTVSWLFEGKVEHRDSVGSVQIIHPGELNIMTAGRGIAHSELSAPDATIMHGIQLWTVIPNSFRNTAPIFDHYSDLPVIKKKGLKVRLIVGEFMKEESEARIFSPLVGAEINLAAGSSYKLPVRTDFEYGALLVAGDIVIDEESVPLTNLYYSAPGKSSLQISTVSGAKFVLLGGAPFLEEIVMWWNFIGRSHEEIVEMRADWNGESKSFPHFADKIGGRIPAPELPNLRLQPRGNIRPAVN